MLLKNKFTPIFQSILYACFNVFFTIDWFLAKESGDIHNYLFNIKRAIMVGHDLPGLQGSGYYYIIISKFSSIFEIKDPLLIISIIISINSYLLSYKFFSYFHKNQKGLISFIFILMVLFTPKVIDLIVSNTRSGLAIVIFLYGINSFNKFNKILLISLSASIHLIVLPILAIYLLFYFLKKLKISVLDSPIKIILLFCFSFILVNLMKTFHYTGEYYNGLLYTVLIYIITVVFIALAGQKITKDISFFVSLGLLFMCIISSIIDYNLIRYLGVVFILIGLFVVNSNNNILFNFSFMYFFLFIVYLYYWLK